jgi:hypothetical protein
MRHGKFILVFKLRKHLSLSGCKRKKYREFDKAESTCVKQGKNALRQSLESH